MSIVGIVAEYNPFHFGHAYHLRQTRVMVPDSTVVCVMSGDFVQRGEAAIYSKFARAEAACRCRVDLVVELPLPWALSSAEAFARGAVGLLAALGAEYISFGSELGETKRLEQTADVLLRDEFADYVKNIMSSSPALSFAAARELAVQRLGGMDTYFLKNANNILGVEYIKAIRTLAPQIVPLTVRRVGNGHDASGEAGFLSASEIRERLRNGERAENLVPASAAAVYRNEEDSGRVFSFASWEIAVLSRLRLFNKEYFSQLPDASDGLGDRIYKAVRDSGSLDELYAAAKSKKYALSRIRRVTMCAALGVTEGMNEGIPPYARVLAANEKGCALLRKLREQRRLPILTKTADVCKYSDDCINLFAVGTSAHDLYALAYSDKTQRKGGRDWRISPKIVKSV